MYFLALLEDLVFCDETIVGLVVSELYILFVEEEVSIKWMDRPNVTEMDRENDYEMNRQTKYQKHP